MVWAAAALLLLAGVFLQRAIGRERPRVARGDEVALLLPAPYVRVLSLGYTQVAADLVWLRAIQYFGEHTVTDGRFPQFAPLLDLATSLDPRFIDVYRLGGLLLAFTVEDPDAAVRLLEKGAGANPDRWELPYDLGIIHYLKRKDYSQALRWFQAADRVPGRPPHLVRLVARLYGLTGQREVAIALWLEIYRTNPLEWVRSVAATELAKLGVRVR